MTNAETVDLADKLGIPVKSHSSSMNEPYADMVRRRAERDGLDGQRKSSRSHGQVAVRVQESLHTTDQFSAGSDGARRVRRVSMDQCELRNPGEAGRVLTRL